MLVVKNIFYSIHSKALLQHISFNAEAGELIAIIGPNGAGKTTLLKSIANEIAFEGEISFKEKNIKLWNEKELAQHKAKFSQHHAQDIPLTAQEVVMMGRYPYFGNTPNRKDLQIVAKAMQLAAISSFRKQPYNQLSGGEKQRVHLARVMAQLDNNIQHKLLLLDEPLNNLDVYHQHQILKKIKSFTQKENTGIIVMHDLNLAAQFADKVLLLKQGNLVAQGTPAQVLQPEIIGNAYEFPCQLMAHPLAQSPMIIFGEPQKQSISSAHKINRYEYRN